MNGNTSTLLREAIENLDKAIELAENMQSEIDRLKLVLSEVQWVSAWPDDSRGRILVCPWCYASKSEGHAKNCDRQTALGKKKT